MTTNPPNVATAATAATAAAARADRVNGQCMQASLGTLLDQVAGARAVVPHLAALERALGALGAKAIESIPPAGLARICAQLACLPLPLGEAPLQELQARLNKALVGDAPVVMAARTPPKDASVTAMPFVDSQLLSVGEASMTDFDTAMAAQPLPDAFGEQRAHAQAR